MLNEKQKQDCEIKVFERMARRIKNNYPKQSFIITANALYCTSPMMDICKKNKRKYIFNLNDRLKTVFKDFNDYIDCFNDSNIKNYFLDNNYKCKNHKFNIIKYTENQKKHNFSHLVFEITIF